MTPITQLGHFGALAFVVLPHGAPLGDEGCWSQKDQEGVRVHDQFDVTLEDSDLLGEVELTTNLIIAASESDEPLTVDEIDRILGLPAESDA